MNSRRNFIKKAGIGTLALSTLSSFKETGHPSLKPNFNIGIAGYTFRELNIDKSLLIMQKSGVKYLSIKSFHLPLDSSQAVIDLFIEKLKSYNVWGYTVGPIYMHSEDEVDDAFSYAKRVGVEMMIGVPDYELLPYVEKQVKTYNIRLAIHNHGPDNLLYPTAGFIIEKIKKLDPRIGICLDIGHNIRAGEPPSYALKKYSNRIFDMHIKDLDSTEKGAHDVILGRGVIPITDFFKTLKKTDFRGVCSIEFEKDRQDPLAGVAESVGYLKGVIDSI